MNLIERIELMKRVDALIRRKATGTPQDLARKLNKSESFVYRLIRSMRDMGAPIEYSESRGSYYYEYEVNFKVGFMDISNKTTKIVGGMKKNHTFFAHCQNLTVTGYSFGVEMFL